MIPTQEHYAYGERQAARILQEGLVSAGQSLLDYGAGLGRLALPLAEHGCHVVPVEQAQDRTKHLRSLGLSPVHSLDGAIDAAGFDAALCFFVLQHNPLQRAQTIVANVGDRLKPGGLLLWTYPTEPRGQDYFHVTHQNLPSEPTNAVSRWMEEQELPILFANSDFDVGTLLRRDIVGVDVFSIERL